MGTFDDVIDCWARLEMAVGVSGKCGSGVGDVEDSTEFGLLKAA